MKINDRIYGEEEINNSLLLDLINSKPVQRLKGISQLGPPQEYYHVNTFSRYEHSLGVLILLRRLRAGTKEQVAGLLHDVSHMAFSHIFDWIIGNSEKEDNQDKNHFNFIKDSDIPMIIERYNLERYNLNFNEISRLENFSLLDKPVPDLCVDRFDYSIREIFDWIDSSSVPFYVQSLSSSNGNLIFLNKDAGEGFARAYLKCQVEHWGGVEARARYFLFAELFRYAINKKIISLEDFAKIDNGLMSVLKKSDDELIYKTLDLLKRKRIASNSGNGIGVILKKKFRYVDPYILVDKSVRKLSSISEDYCSLLEREKKNSQIERKIFFENPLI